MTSLAIVIPAYKADFLPRVLDSLSRQTCQDFVVYIGDDASPYDLYSVVEQYRDRLNIVYRRFDDNLGGTDLVAQWQRCIDMVQDEEWIQLFSDDDEMECNCISRFYETCADCGCDVLHFDIDIIDENDTVVRECQSFPLRMSTPEFIDMLGRRIIDARMPEFIFRRSKLAENGLVKFDLAWRSDTATVASCSCPGGIYTVAGDRCRVLWRASTQNISSLEHLKNRKNEVNILFYNWLYSFFHTNGLTLPMKKIFQDKTIVFAIEYRGWKNFLKDGWHASRALSFVKGLRWPVFIALLFYRLVYRNFEK